MNKTNIVGAVFVLVSAASASAVTSAHTLRGAEAYVQTYITAGTAADVAAARTYGSYTGVGTLFVTTASTAVTGFGGLCTGALTSNRTVVTAGHCLSNKTQAGKYDPVTSVRFFLPSLGERTKALTFVGHNIVVNPNFDITNILGGNDIAQFQLIGNAPTAGYQLYTAQNNSEIGSVFTRVGTGTIGDMTGTSAGPFDYDQRAGVNLWEAKGDTFGVSASILFSDFDDGTAAHDVFGQLGINSQTGIVDSKGHLIDTNSSPGDSGGPEFINGKIAGITSFGVSAAAFQGGHCGTGYIDPYAAPDGRCTNSSVGELSGDTQVSAFLPFVNDYIASVPEPAAWTSMIVGFGFVGAAVRRRSNGFASA